MSHHHRTICAAVSVVEGLGAQLHVPLTIGCREEKDERSHCSDDEEYDEKNWLQIPGGPGAFTRLDGSDS